jgi:hypothetical protein
MPPIIDYVFFFFSGFFIIIFIFNLWSVFTSIKKKIITSQLTNEIFFLCAL